MPKLNVSNEQLVIIAKALGAQPYDMVASTIAELHRQIAAQQEAPPPPASTRANGEDRDMRQ